MKALWIFLTVVIVSLIPLCAGLAWRRRFDSMRPVWMGVMGFFAFSSIAEMLFVSLCLSALGPVSAWLNASPVRLIVFSCLCAGLFEECGRYVIYKSGLPNCSGRAVASGYAIGHFGAEILILTVYPLLSRAPEVYALAQAAPAVFERAAACAGHTALSVLVWYAFCERKKGMLALAVLIHAVCDAPMGMMRYGLAGTLQADALFGLFILLLCIFALRYWRKLPAGAMIKA